MHLVFLLSGDLSQPCHLFKDDGAREISRPEVEALTASGSRQMRGTVRRAASLNFFDFFMFFQFGILTGVFKTAKMT